MDIQRCFEVLELDRDASFDEVKQAYKDLVNVWHPDRFSNNPRLRRKAEEKLKEANLAYKGVKSFISLRQKGVSAKETARQGTSRVMNKADSGIYGAETEYYHEQREAQARAEPESLTEAFVEAGTRGILTLWSHLYTAIRRVVEEARAEIEKENFSGGQERSDGKEKGTGRGKDM
ncbi:MAG: J domain-containing protein [Pseudomonadota bacterium]